MSVTDTDRSSQGKATAETLDELSENNIPITVAEVKDVTGFGDSGSVLVSELANADGVTFSQAKNTVETAYLAGFTGLDESKATFATDTQRLAFRAGSEDRRVQNNSNAEKAQSASVYENGFTENEYSAKLTPAEREVFTFLAKDLKMDAKIVDELIVARVNGKAIEADGRHQDGQMRVSSTANSMLGAGFHEALHRVKQLDPEAFGALADFIYNHTDKSSILYEQIKAEHDSANIAMEADDIIEEVVIRQLENFARNPEALIEWRKSLDANPVAKSGWQKFCEALKTFLENVWAAITDSKMSLDAKRQAQAEIDEARRLLDNAYKGAMQAADGRAKEIQQNSEVRVQKNTVQNGDRQYSIRKEYANEVETWSKKGRPDGETFILGMTGDVLQGLGAIESDIYMLGDKIKEILSIHPEMTIEEIKRIPQILENPVLILKSKNENKNNTRLVIFGNVKAQDGKPILSVLDLRPIENNLVVDDMQKVSSAYTKDTNPVEFIRNSLVVYADKKRTTKLLKSIGFKMPIELQQSGYIGSISYFKRSVNIFGESFSKVFKEIDEKSNKASVENQFYENFSLKGGIKINSQTPEMLDTIEELQNGDKSAADRLAKYVDNGMISTEAYKGLIERYGAIPKGENPHRDIQVPKKTTDDKKVSQTVRTILEAKATLDEAVPTIEKMVEDGVFSYDAYSDKKAIGDAESDIQKRGWVDSLDSWLDSVKKGVVSKKTTAMG